MLRDDDVVLVVSNAPDTILAERISRVLVEGGLAACVNFGAPVRSVYSWNGQIETAEEIPLWIKTTAGRQQALVQALAELHPYEVPEILIVPVAGGMESYLQWVRQHTAVSSAS